MRRVFLALFMLALCVLGGSWGIAVTIAIALFWAGLSVIGWLVKSVRVR